MHIVTAMLLDFVNCQILHIWWNPRFFETTISWNQLLFPSTHSNTNFTTQFLKLPIFSNQLWFLLEVWKIRIPLYLREVSE